MDRFTIMRMPCYLCDVPYVDPPVPVNDVASHRYWLQRIRYPMWQEACFREVQRCQRHAGLPMLFPCSWCGYATGDYCESCAGHAGPACPICTVCEAVIRRCRLCRLELQLEDGLPRSSHVPPRSAWYGTSKCGMCGLQDLGYKLCSGCMCVRYCSGACARRDWPRHRELCYILRARQPLSYAFPWQSARVSAVCAVDSRLSPPARQCEIYYEGSCEPVD